MDDRPDLSRGLLGRDWCRSGLLQTLKGMATEITLEKQLHEKNKGKDYFKNKIEKKQL